ncbi:hypothetical protein JZ751_019833 [Albula glossodonta]|uniref:Arginine vasopressin-induced protein 1 n=1 Tax=Albula glossodonta TaxID=121402 RepID=A0A8T2NLH5_9TELE|nr:hypothetical protein JZ751_019833 [Albula glossodonta]
MEAPAVPSSSVAGPSQLWSTVERRGRKAGSPNIFRGVNLRQLQRLFRTSGDQDADRRAELVWGQGNGVELAQALIGLRARRRSSRLAKGASEAIGSKWLRAFGHLRINEGTATGSDEDDTKDRGMKADTLKRSAVDLQGGSELKGDATTADSPEDSDGIQGVSSRSSWSRSEDLKKGNRGDPERYLHRILHL